MQFSLTQGYQRVEQEESAGITEKANRTSPEELDSSYSHEQLSGTSKWTTWSRWIPWVLVACLATTNWYTWAHRKPTYVSGEIFCKPFWFLILLLLLTLELQLRPRLQ